MNLPSYFQIFFFYKQAVCSMPQLSFVRIMKNRKKKNLPYITCRSGITDFMLWISVPQIAIELQKYIQTPKSTLKASLKKKDYQCYRSQEKRWCLTSMSRTPSRSGLWSWLGGGGSSQSGFSVKGNCARTRNSHLICTQPGDFRNDHGWYHRSTTSALEQRTSSQRCNTYNNESNNNNMVINLTSYIEEKNLKDKIKLKLCYIINFWKLFLLLTCSFSPKQTRERNLTSICAWTASWLTLIACTHRYSSWNFQVLYWVNLQNKIS